MARTRPITTAIDPTRRRGRAPATINRSFRPHTPAPGATPGEPHHRNHIQLQNFSAEDRKRHRQPAANGHDPERPPTGLLFRDLRCRRLDAEQHLRHRRLDNDQGIDVAPHLSCIGSSTDEITRSSTVTQARGITRIVALRGDLPSGAGAGAMGDLNHANELVALIRRGLGTVSASRLRPTPEMHPQAPNFNPRPGQLQTQSGCRRRLGDHPVLLQCRRVQRVHRCLHDAFDRYPGRTRDHADHQFQQPGAFFRCLRRRDPTLAAQTTRGLRRRHRQHPQHSAPRWSPTCACACSTPAPQACTSTP